MRSIILNTRTVGNEAIFHLARGCRELEAIDVHAGFGSTEDLTDAAIVAESELRELPPAAIAALGYEFEEA